MENKRYWEEGDDFFDTHTEGIENGFIPATLHFFEDEHVFMRASVKKWSDSDMIALIHWLRSGGKTPFTDYIAAQKKYGKEILSDEDIFNEFITIESENK